MRLTIVCFSCLVWCLASLGFGARAHAQTGTPEVPAGYQSSPPPQPPPPPPPPPQQQPQPTTTDQPAPTRALHSLSVTISPVHLLFPIVELMGDFRVIDKLSVAAIVGFGSVPIMSGPDVIDRATAVELGAQLKFYAIGDFDHALQLGLEALYVHVSTDFGSSAVVGTGSGLAIGPFIGYKFVASFGLSIDLELGVQLAGIAASATDGTTTESATSSDVIPLLNLNFGWSF